MSQKIDEMDSDFEFFLDNQVCDKGQNMAFMGRKQSREESNIRYVNSKVQNWRFYYNQIVAYLDMTYKAATLINVANLKFDEPPKHILSCDLANFKP